MVSVKRSGKRTQLQCLVFDHSSTYISAAIGEGEAAKMKGENRKSISVIVFP
jgi:deoxyxylulose-5-phosphate synthase